MDSYEVCTECNMDLIVKDLDQCDRFCSVNPDSNQTDLKFSLEVVCRTETFLYIRVDTHLSADDIDAVIYKFHKFEADGVSQPFYYHENRMLDIKFSNLTEDSVYKMSVMAYNKDLQLIGKSMEYRFFTLRGRDVPDVVRRITLQNITLDETHPNKVKALVAWEPPADRNCDYEIVSIIEGEIPTRTENSGPDRDMFYSEITNIEMGKRLDIGVRAISASYLEGELRWATFKIPTCLSLFEDDLSMCQPEKPEGLQFNLNYVFIGYPSMEITWDKPRLLPDYYEVLISVLSPKITTSTYKHVVLGTETRLIIESFNGTGFEVEVSLEAHSKGGASKAVVVRSLLQMQEEIDKPDVMIIAIPFMCIGVLVFIVPMFVSMIVMVKSAKSLKRKKANQGKKLKRIVRGYVVAKVLDNTLKEVVAK